MYMKGITDMNRTPLTDKYGRPYAYLDIDANGDIFGRDVYGRIMASYRAATNTTHEGLFGRILGYGNTVAAYLSPNN